MLRLRASAQVLFVLTLGVACLPPLHSTLGKECSDSEPCGDGLVCSNASCAEPSAVSGIPTSPPAGWGAATLADDFNGSSINTSTWKIYDQTAVFNTTPGPWWNASHITTDGGLATLRIYQDTAEGQASGTWESGGMSQWPSAAQTYGKWEVRAKMSNGTGMTAGLLLWPQAGNWPVGGEINFAENRGYSPRNIAYLTNHYACPGTNNDCNDQLLVSVDWTEFHTFGVEWTPGKIIYTIDGTAVGNAAINVPSGPMYLTIQDSATLNSTCGGFDACVDATTPPETDLVLDWVVAWSYTP